MAPVVSCVKVDGSPGTTVAVAGVSFGAGAADAAVASTGTMSSAAAAAVSVERSMAKVVPPSLNDDSSLSRAWHTQWRVGVGTSPPLAAVGGHGCENSQRPVAGASRGPRGADPRRDSAAHLRLIGIPISRICGYSPGVPTFRIKEAADLLGVSADTLRRWADGGRIETTTDGSGRLGVDGAVLARFAEELAHDAAHLETG